MADEFDDFDDAPSRGRVEPHRGVVILVLGLLGILMSCGVLSIIAWVMDKGDLEKMKRGRMDREGEGLTRAGYVLGIVGTVLMIIVVVIVLGAIALGFGIAAAGR